MMSTAEQPQPISDPRAQDVARRWVAAFNTRDAEALVAIAHPKIEFSPTVLVGDRRTYNGHKGLRQWLSDLKAARAAHTVRVAVVRRCRSGAILLIGDILVDDYPVGVFTSHLTLEDSLVVRGQAYLSDEELLVKLGLVDN